MSRRVSLSTAAKTVASISLVEENLDKDYRDWISLTLEERKFICRVLVFLAAYSDDIAHEYLIGKIPEESVVHLFSGSDMDKTEYLRIEVYSFFIQNYITNPEERNYLFETMPSVRRKTDWLSARLRSAGEAVIAFATQKEIFFSGSFAILFWLEKRGLMNSLTSINELVSRIQGSCTYIACMLHRCGKLIQKPTRDEIIAIVREAVAIEQEFLSSPSPTFVIGMNSESLRTYVEFVADRLLVKLDCPKIYNVENPFNFIHHCPTSLNDKINFFMKKVKEFQKIRGNAEFNFSLDASF